ncbi:hypothetical protein FRACYDRAFT_254483 [Fragilariopsis cylindrus CCMP1102]|uniref:Lon N-terminal domain-containing protein n=1 Tax=Fragilariopsis cylindrus CCMP1102 TaxID=635003 RepID=A0A1E7EKQ1_9STRA|nr:hypothetical protein FRACYDRAFT_254483 [Fragilariopsis cylindrus CCMP1102]|eukprot:OEU06466.1 hypothetical protein FRACYDRAFT_254483 [Fragilariopsis cylindrus CCMP1102]
MIFIWTVVWILLGEEVQSLSSTSTSATVRLLVLDTLVPGQRLRLDTEQPPRSFEEFCRNEQDPIVVVGREGLSLHARGVEVVLLEDSSNISSSTSDGCSSTPVVTLATTGRIAEIDDEGIDEGSRWNGRQGRVRWLTTNLNEDDLALSVDEEPTEVTTEKIMALCATIGDLASEWEETVKVTGRERFPGQLRGIVHDLGCSIPEEPNARALWVAALINPLPALGVALEIRPAVLTARTTSRRLRVAQQGLQDSIDRMRRSPGSCF